MPNNGNGRGKERPAEPAEQNNQQRILDQLGELMNDPSIAAFFFCNVSKDGKLSLLWGFDNDEGPTLTKQALLSHAAHQIMLRMASNPQARPEGRISKPTVLDRRHLG